MAITKQELQKQLLRFFEGDKNRLKKLAVSCKELGFPIGENIESIQKNPEQFQILITFSDLGMLEKITNSLEILKEK